MGMEEIFGGAASAPAEAPVAESSETSKDRKKQKLAEWKDSLKLTIEQDKTYLAKRGTLSKSLKVVNTLGYGTGGNILLDKEATKKTGSRQVKGTSKIVGYLIENCGTEPITYETEVWTKDETGVFVAKNVTKTLAPGQQTAISRKWLTALTAKPEFSFMLENGKIVSSSSNTEGKGIDAILEAHYFVFSKETGLEVNDDAIKNSIDVDNVVKPEYEETFGYLNNPKASKAGKRGKGGQKGPTAQELAANYINRLIHSEQSVQ